MHAVIARRHWRLGVIAIQLILALVFLGYLLHSEGVRPRFWRVSRDSLLSDWARGDTP